MRLGIGAAIACASSALAPHAAHAATYARLSYDPQIRPFSGGFSMMGRYDLFGGGNGLPIGPVQVTSSGGRLYANVQISGDTAPLGSALGNGPGGSALASRGGAFLSGSSGNVTWRGQVTRGLLTFTYMHYVGNVLRLDVYGPRGAHTWFQIDETGTADDGRAAGDVVWGNAWQLLTFDATQFLSSAGPGTYTCVLTQTGTSNASDMGWSLYGVSDVSGIAGTQVCVVAGTVAEKPINAGEVARADFPSEITPNGGGKVFYVVHGGEDREPDWLDLVAVSGGSERYLKFGSPGTYSLGGQTVSSEAVITRNELDPGGIWDPLDIARPNHAETAPAGLVNYVNRQAMGLGDFDGLAPVPIRGARKVQGTGNDVFGAMILLADVPAAKWSADVVTRLGLVGCDRLPASVAGPTAFSYSLEPLGGAPAPTDASGHAVSQLSVSFPAGSAASELRASLGTFSLPSEGTYRYRVTCARTASDFVSYDASWERTLSLSVAYDRTSNAYRVTPSWTDDATGAPSSATFSHAYSEGTLSFAKEQHGIWLPSRPLPGATFALWRDVGASQALRDYAGHALVATSDAAGRVSFSHAPVGDWWCHEGDVPWDIIPNVVSYAAHVGPGGSGSGLSHDGAPVPTVPDRIKPGWASMGKGTAPTW